MNAHAACTNVATPLCTLISRNKIPLEEEKSVNSATALFELLERHYKSSHIHTSCFAKSLFPCARLSQHRLKEEASVGRNTSEKI